MQEENLPKVLPLKNGTEIDMRDGLALLEIVRDLAEDQPHHFQNLLALAQGREVQDSNSIKFLRNCGLLLRTKAINPNVQNLLNSAYEDTPEGPVLANPFKITDAAQALALDQFAQQGYIRLLHFLRGGHDQGKTS